MTKYRFTSAALSELREATLYYEQQEKGLGVKFLDEIDATVDRLRRFPYAWHPSRREADDVKRIAFRSDCCTKLELMRF
jgi:plasmid stabilization system protein ParE